MKTITTQTAPSITYRYEILGTCDSVNDCECCGRGGLKKTIALRNESGETVYFGSSCAALAMRGTRKEGRLIENLATKAENKRREISGLVKDLARCAEMVALGHDKYLIGDKPIGAKLSYLIESYTQRLEHLQSITI